MVTIILTSWTAFRHAFYETFLHIHIALVSLILAALYIHLEQYAPNQHTWIKVVISIWVIEVFSPNPSPIITILIPTSASSASSP